MGGIESQLVIGLSVVLLAWYFIGQQAMRKRGLALLQWVRQAAPILGESPKLRWLGGSAFQLTLEHPAHPFKAVVITVVLEPREILFMWLINRFRKRRDLLVVRGDLVAQPRMTFELFREEGRSGQEARAWATGERWPIEPFDKGGLQLAAAPMVHEALRTSLQPVHEELPALLRLSIRRTSPHILLTYTLQTGREGRGGQVFQWLVDLARTLLTSRPA